MKKLVKTLDLTPNWANMVLYYHSIPEVKFWKKVLLPENDENGWFAAVAKTHPELKIQKLGNASKQYDATKTYSGVRFDKQPAFIEHKIADLQKRRPSNPAMQALYRATAGKEPIVEKKI